MKLAQYEREHFADNIREELAASGRVLVIYEPGDGTHYEFAIVRIGGMATTSAPVSAGRVRQNHARDRFLMADGDGHRAMTVDLSDGHYTDPNYILEKWRTTQGSAVVVAELLNMITRADALDNMRGAYPYVFKEDDPDA